MWFHQNLKDKGLMEGDLVLMLSVHNTKKKLKYQAMDPYRVVEITPQGIVRIATLSGVIMDGYINGSKLKKLYRPLNLQTLQAIHRDQGQKKEQLLLKKKAQQEAKAREAKLKSKSWPITLYKATLEQNNKLDREPQIEQAKLMINLQITQGSSIGMEENFYGPKLSTNPQSYKSLLQGKEGVLWIPKGRNKPHHQTTPLWTQGPNNCQPYQDR